MTSWYYVEGGDRVGPVEESELHSLFSNGTLNENSYVWKKGMENWEKAEVVSELSSMLSRAEINFDGAPLVKEINWNNISSDEKIFMIKVGIDRGTAEAEYGPFSMSQLKQAYDERRINDKTLIFVSGMESWVFLAELPIYEKVFNQMPPVIGEIDRRECSRKPFVARLFYHDNEQLFEGICRDISIGGMQVLVSGAPVNIGEKISLNVHPENTDFSFVADGEVVRILDGGQGFSLRFRDLKKDAKAAIEKYIEQH